MAESAVLLEASRCYDQCIPDGAKLGVLIYLALQTAGLDMTPAQLMDASRCYDQCIPQGAKLAALMYLFENGGGGGGGGGSGVVSSGAIDPVAAPSDPTVDNWYVNTAAGTAWLWPANGAAWQQIV